MRGEVYNLGNDSVNMSKLDLVKKICHETRAVWVEVQDKTDPDKRDYIVSSQKLYDTGFKPKYNLDYGIKQMMMVCFRLATVYGRSHRQRMDLLVNNLVYSSMINRRLEVFDGHFRRNYIHVDDIVSAFAHTLDNFESMRGEVYNLGNDSVNMSKLDLVKKICHETRAVWVEVQDKTDPDKRDYIVSSQKLYDTGFKPKYNLDYGIKQMMMVCSENWKNFADVDYMSMCKNY